MKKKTITTFIIVSILLMLFQTSVSAVSNNNILTLSASVSEHTVSVSGTAESEVLAGVVVVYNSTETTMLDMESFEVGSDNTFSYTLTNTFDDGTYVIKVADYDGGQFKSITVTIPEPTPPTNDDSSSTTTTTTTTTTSSTYSVVNTCIK